MPGTIRAFLADCLALACLLGALGTALIILAAFTGG